MNRIDRNSTLQFLKVAIFAIVAFCLIFILVDMIENLDDFLDEDVPPHIIAAYYVYFLPRIMSLMVPVALLLAALFVVGKMSNDNELTVIKCSGMSLYRFMVPYLVVGLCVSSVMLLFDGWLVPRINAARLTIERVYMKKSVQTGGRYNLFFQDVGNHIVSLEYYDENSARARRVTILRFRSDDPTIVSERFDAASMRWHARSKSWMLYNGYRRTFIQGATHSDIDREQVVRFDSVAAPRLTIQPEMILRMQQKPEEMELGDFRDYIRRQQRAGSDIDRLLVDYHGKIAFPFASLIVVFFGVPFASVKRRSGLSVQFGISIFICFTYLVSQKLSQVFGYNGTLPAFVAAWLPNVLFLLSGAFVMLKVPK